MTVANHPKTDGEQENPGISYSCAQPRDDAASMRSLGKWAGIV
jgi:hypothetical protein